MILKTLYLSIKNFFFFFKKKLKILITELKCEIFLLNEKNKNEILKYC